MQFINILFTLAVGCIAAPIDLSKINGTATGNLTDLSYQLAPDKFFAEFSLNSGKTLIHRENVTIATASNNTDLYKFQVSWSKENLMDNIVRKVDRDNVNCTFSLFSDQDCTKPSGAVISSESFNSGDKNKTDPVTFNIGQQAGDKNNNVKCVFAYCQATEKFKADEKDKVGKVDGNQVAKTILNV